MEKLFTLEEAERLLPALRPLLEELRATAARLRDAGARLGALVQEHGGERALDAPGHAQRDAYWALVREARAAELRLEELLDEVRFLGAEPKDLDRGLVDFRSRRGGETVYLCWQLGEAGIGWWHPLATGFAGRQPLDEAPVSHPGG